ncbi:MAG TPA: hypothetical protein PKK26_01255 [Candidatus Wallbacteria bacterium]|nr:hypothetical protein [Candidatus Wallbacteria bacterium]
MNLKKIAVAATLAILFSPLCANGAGLDTAIKKEKVIDRIKQFKIRSVTHYIYDYENGCAYKSYLYEYDRAGNPVRSMAYNHDRTVREESVYKQENEKYISGVEYTSNKNVSRRTIYKYDDFNNIIELERYGPGDRLDGKTVFRMNFDENTVDEITYDAAGKISSKKSLLYRCDSRGNVIEKTSYGTNGRVEDRNVFKYDGKGHVEKANRFDRSGASSTQSYQYDENGNVVFIVNRDEKGAMVSAIKTVYTYYR